MRQITSPEFRKTYPRLTEPVEVTALGRVIGTYWPTGSTVLVDGSAVGEWFEGGTGRQMTQAERDRILRRVNTKS